MAFKRPTPKNLSADEMSNIVTSCSQQTGKSTRIRTYDKDYPVFEVPINKKVLAYIPNHVITTPEGTVDLRKDKFAAHQVIDGRNFCTIRCSSGIQSESLGLDGTCPLCDASGEVWDLYNKEYAEIALQKGIATDSPEAKDGLKQTRIDLLNKQVIKPAEVWLTFPIVVIDCVEKDGQSTTTPKRNDKGEIMGTPMWYSIREKTYTEKWGKALETAPSEDDMTPVHPGGLWAVLNFTYESKDGKHDKMGSARALAVGFKSMGADFAPWASHFDELTEGWTPEKAMEVLVDNQLRDMSELTDVANQLLKPVRDKLSMYALAGGAVATPNAGAIPTSADSALSSFGAVPASVPEVPQVPTGDASMGVQ